MNLELLEKIISSNIQPYSKEFHRVFHGRGNFYSGFENITVDSIDSILFLSIFKPIDYESSLVNLLENYCKKGFFDTFIVQKRYEKKSEVICGELGENIFALENDLKFKLNLLDNQNIGFFPDMKNGRKFVKKISQDKKVLNLFSYTCSLGVAAMAADAKEVVNVDMAKSALNTGRENHRLNSQNMSKVHFLPYNILKSWSKIRKYSPYDLIIIDPPSFQKGSFSIQKDYQKIIKKIEELTNKRAIVIACINDPFIKIEFLIELFTMYASSFHFVRRVKNHRSFPTNDSQSDLKCLVFKNY